MPLPALSAPTKVRLGFAVIALLYAVLTESVVATLPWLLLVLSLDLTATALAAIPGLGDSRVRWMTLSYIVLSAAGAGAAFGIRGVTTAPLILIAAYHAGLRFQRTGYLTACFLAVVTAVLTNRLLDDTPQLPVQSFIAWAVAALTLGALGTWSHRLSLGDTTDEDPPEVTEAIALIHRLRELSERMDTGFDAPARASAALAALHRIVPTERSVILLGASAEALAPVAMRGATRVPWLGGGGVTSIFDSGSSATEAVVQQWADEHGARTVLAVPIVSRRGQRLGLLVADRPGGESFSDEERATAARIARRAAPSLDAAVLFGDLRARASLEERQRLARDIHDGIAQAIAALGFQIDALRIQAQATENPLADQLDELRGSLRSTLLDVRLHISDLNMAQRPETSLGAVIGSAVQNFGAVTGIDTTVSISEGMLRLPSHVELPVYRLTMDVLADAQASSASQAAVTVRVDAPEAQVTVSHDGRTQLRPDAFADHPLRAEGATITVTPATESTGVQVQLAISSRQARTDVVAPHPMPIPTEATP